MKVISLLFSFSVLVLLSGGGRLEADNRLEAASQTAKQQMKLKVEAESPVVTAGDYCLFLNAVAPSDSDGLYEESASSIIRSGGPGHYSYVLAEENANDPINYVSWQNAAHYYDWKESAASTSTFTFNCCQPTSSWLAACDSWLQSNRISISLPAFCMMRSSASGGNLTEEEMAWGKVFVGGLLGLGFVLSGRELASAEARRNVPVPEIRIQEEPRQQVYISRAELYKQHQQQAAQRMAQEANQRNIEQKFPSWVAVQTAKENLAEAMHARDELGRGHLSMAAQHLMTGLGHGATLIATAIYPLVIVAHGAALGSIEGYGVGGVGGYLSGETAVASMHIGILGAELGATLGGIGSSYLLWRRGDHYCGVLHNQYKNMRDSFRNASEAWGVLSQAKEAEKRVVETRFALKAQYETFMRENPKPHPIYENLRQETLLQSAAWKLVDSAPQTEEEYRPAFENFIMQGNRMLGEEGMKVALPETQRQEMITKRSPFTVEQIDKILAFDMKKCDTSNAYRVQVELPAAEAEYRDLVALAHNSDTPFQERLRGLYYTAALGARVMTGPVFKSVLSGALLGLLAPIAITGGAISHGLLGDLIIAGAVAKGLTSFSINRQIRNPENYSIRENADLAVAAFHRAAEAARRPAQIEAARQRVLAAGGTVE